MINEIIVCQTCGTPTDTKKTGEHVCPWCELEGKGKEGWNGVCKRCMASGRLVSLDGETWISPLQAHLNLKGRGRVDHIWKDCPDCDGTGVIIDS